MKFFLFILTRQYSECVCFLLFKLTGKQTARPSLIWCQLCCLLRCLVWWNKDTDLNETQLTVISLRTRVFFDTFNSELDAVKGQGLPGVSEQLLSAHTTGLTGWLHWAVETWRSGNRDPHVRRRENACVTSQAFTPGLLVLHHVGSPSSSDTICK